VAARPSCGSDRLRQHPAALRVSSGHGTPHISRGPIRRTGRGSSHRLVRAPNNTSDYALASSPNSASSKISFKIGSSGPSGHHPFDGPRSFKILHVLSAADSYPGPSVDTQLANARAAWNVKLSPESHPPGQYSRRSRTKLLRANRSERPCFFASSRSRVSNWTTATSSPSSCTSFLYEAQGWASAKSVADRKFRSRMRS
jgi:hypothetical protein